jgi:phosphoribosylanthranilate isomerase
MDVAVKICGLNNESAVRAVIKANADYAGFVHYPKSPRHVSIEQAAKLKSLLPPSIKSVMVLVNPSDGLLTEIFNIMRPDFFQLHGDESPERLGKIRQKFPQIKLIRAISVRNSDDIKKAQDFYKVCDFLLFDAKPSGDNMIHGGNGISFDWSLLAENTPTKNWFLAGGLNAQNIKEALMITGAKFIDVSSGVESSAGVKDAGMIEEFIKVVRQ